MVINKIVSKGYLKITVSRTPSWSTCNLQGRIRIGLSNIFGFYVFVWDRAKIACHLYFSLEKVLVSAAPVFAGL